MSDNKKPKREKAKEHLFKLVQEYLDQRDLQKELVNQDKTD